MCRHTSATLTTFSPFPGCSSPNVNMAILAASRKEPSVSLRTRLDLLGSLRPTLDFSLRLQQLATTASLFLILRACFLGSIVLSHLWLVCRVLSVQAFLTTRLLGLTIGRLAKSAVWRLWRSKAVRRLRKKLVMEFFVLVLGPSGNALVLVIFWPGWLVLAGLVWLAWIWAG